MSWWLLVLFLQDPQAAFNRGEYATAIRLFQAAQQRKPECANVLYIGLARYRLRQNAEALISFRAAVQCDPKLVAAHLALGEAFAEGGNDREALAAYLRVIELEPKNSVALRAASNLYLKNDLHDKARALLERDIAIKPTAGAHADLGAVYAASGDRVAAEGQFRHALTIDSHYFPALAGLGNLMARAGDSAAALPMLRRAVSVRPKAFEAHFLLGSALNRLDQFAEARMELEAAAMLGGAREPQVYYQLARAWGGLGNALERKAALAKFAVLTKQEKEVVERQKRAAALIDEARSLLQAGELEQAALRLEQARELRPGDSSLLFRLAGLNFDLQRWGVAREYAQAAISISPATWLYHYLLGLIEKSSDRLSEAQASLETASKLDTTQAPVFNALGEVAIARGEFADAVAHFERACALAPAEAAYRQNLEHARKR